MAPSLFSDSSADETLNGKPTVYILDDLHPDVHAYCEKNFNAIKKGDPDHGKWKAQAEYLLVRSSYLTADDIKSCVKLRAIGKQGVGVDKIDVAACEARGIPILNTPGVNAQSVAELVLALTMAVARQFGSIISKQSSDVIVPKETCSGLLIYRKTIGVIGMGNIGQAVARTFRGAFEAQIIGYDPFLPEDAWSKLSCTRAKSVQEVLAVSDVVSVHMPLTPETQNLIGYEEMKQMKHTAIIINTARGGIVNEQELEKALKEGLIWGAGLDCHEAEPPTKERYGSLWESGATSTPHIGAATAETQVMTGMKAAQNLLEFAVGHSV